MAKYRRGRINEALAQELSVALRDARDPGLAEAFISITRAEVAQIFYALLKIFDGKAKDVSVLTYVIAALFLIKFFFVA